MAAVTITSSIKCENAEQRGIVRINVRINELINVQINVRIKGWVNLWIIRVIYAVGLTRAQGRLHQNHVARDTNFVYCNTQPISINSVRFTVQISKSLCFVFSCDDNYWSFQ